MHLRRASPENGIPFGHADFFKILYLPRFMAVTSPETIMETVTQTETQPSALPTWQYLPPIEYGETVQSFGGAPGLRVVFYTNLRSSGMVQYRYLAAVYLGDTMFPLFMVTAETSAPLALEGTGEWALGVFRPEGHATVDISDDYGSWHPFVAAAMGLIAAEFPDSNPVQSS
jgi:hypothetical protein